MKIYVNAWNHNSGGGFDWYKTKKDRDEAFRLEKMNERQFKIYKWKAFSLDMNCPFKTKKAITNWIEEQLVKRGI